MARTTTCILLLLAVVAGCTTSTAQTSAAPTGGGRNGIHDAGHGVVVRASGIDGTVTATPVDIDAPFRGLTAATGTFDVNVDGTLDGTATVELPLPEDVDPDREVIVAVHAEDPTAPWEVVASTVHSTADGRHTLAVDTTEFSLFAGWRVNVDALLDTVERDLLEPLAADLGAAADHPTCPGEELVREDYTITSDSGDTVYWCLGTSDEVPLLRITNNRKYPLELRYSGASVVENPPVSGALAQLSRLGSGASTILEPRSTVGYRIDVKPGDTATVRTKLDGLGQSLYRLEVGAKTALAFLTYFGLEKGTTATRIVDTAVTSSSCLSTLLGETRTGDVIGECLLSDVMAAEFGWKWLLIAPVFTAAAVVAVLDSSWQEITDIVTARDRYTIRVLRNPTLTPPADTAGCSDAPRSRDVERVSRCLYAAWFAGDVELARELTYPQTGVVEELFALTPERAWDFDSCEGFVCRFTEPGPDGNAITFGVAPDVDGDGGLYVGRIEIGG